LPFNQLPAVIAMKQKPFPRKCPQCRKPSVSPVVEDYATTLDHDGRSYEISVPDLTILVCSECGNRTRDAHSDERVVDALRRAAGLLKPDEIRTHRHRLELSQKDLAAHLGIAESTLSRWETGAQIQQRGFDGLLRAYFDLPALREYLIVRTGGQPALASLK